MDILFSQPHFVELLCLASLFEVYARKISGWERGVGFALLFVRDELGG